MENKDGTLSIYMEYATKLHDACEALSIVIYNNVPFPVYTVRAHRDSGLYGGLSHQTCTLTPLVTIIQRNLSKLSDNNIRKLTYACDVLYTLQYFVKGSKLI